MLQVPEGSIYFWMYEQGLKHVSAQEVVDAVYRAGKDIRPKDMENYWSGWYRSSLYRDDDPWKIIRKTIPVSSQFFSLDYSQYPMHPWLDKPDVADRWVPCNSANKPMIKWGQGCMSYADACAYPGQVYLAENMKATRQIVIDCDGDHDAGRLDMATIRFLLQYASQTHCIWKPKMVNEYEGGEDGPAVPASFHLTFQVDRVIPTFHFPYAHIDIIGNKENSLRYFKNKHDNGLAPIQMTDGIWRELRGFIERRRNGDAMGSAQ